jgi:rare lipoprotein A (peptidoglycan hydrolase)
VGSGTSARSFGSFASARARNDSLASGGMIRTTAENDPREAPAFPHESEDRCRRSPGTALADGVAMPRVSLILFAAVLTLAGCAPGSEEAADEDDSALTSGNADPLEVGSKLTTTVNLRLRSEPLKRKDTIKLVMKKGEEVTVLEPGLKNGFAHVSYRNEKEQKNEEGWAWRAYLQGAAKAETASAETPVASSEKTGKCKAGFYTDEFNGKWTANGERFQQDLKTAARQTNFENIFPFSPEGKATVRVTNPALKKSIDVRINDSGSLAEGRCLDLSKAAFAAITEGEITESTEAIDVTYELIDSSSSAP